MTYSDNPIALQTLIERHIDGHRVAGMRWPDDAVFAIECRFSTWPVGWSACKHVEFFSSVDALDDWIEKQMLWARQEDNEAAWRVYEWDLGPNRRADLDRLESNV